MRPPKGNTSFGYLEQVVPGWLRSQTLLLCCISNGEMHRDQSTPKAVKQELCWALAMGAPVCSRSCIWELEPAQIPLHQLRPHAAILGHRGARAPPPLLLLLQISVCKGNPLPWYSRGRIMVVYRGQVLYY